MSFPLSLWMEVSGAIGWKRAGYFLRKILKSLLLGKRAHALITFSDYLEYHLERSDLSQKKQVRRLLAIKQVVLMKAARLLPGVHEPALHLARHYYYWGKIAKAHQTYRNYLILKKETAKQSGILPGSFCFLSEYFPLNIGGIGGLDYLIKRLILDDNPSRVPILLLKKKTSVSNPCLLEYFQQYVAVVREKALVAPLNKIREQIGGDDPTFIMLRNGDEAYEILKEQHLTQQLWEQRGLPPLLKLREDHIERGRAELLKLGVPSEAWFVTLHVRESGYRDGTSLHDISRNASIESYLPAAREIIKAGGWVIRVGDSSMKPVSAFPGFIDYAHSRSKSDWMDIFLFGACRFTLCANSGPQKVVQCFGRPVIQANSPSCAQPEFRDDLYIMKRYFSGRERRPIPFSEVFSYPLGSNGNANYLKYREITFEDNSPEEIREVTQQMLGKLAGTYVEGERAKQLNERLKELSQRGRGYRIGGTAGEAWVCNNESLL